MSNQAFEAYLRGKAPASPRPSSWMDKYIWQTCQNCGGTGTVVISELSAPGAEYGRDATCPTCNGQGYFRGAASPTKPTEQKEATS